MSTYTHVYTNGYVSTHINTHTPHITTITESNYTFLRNIKIQETDRLYSYREESFTEFTYSIFMFLLVIMTLS